MPRPSPRAGGFDRPSRAHTPREGVRRAEDHKVWAREVGAYPIIGILSFAVGFCAWRCTKCATECSDVRWVPSKRQQLIRTWDDTK